MGNRNPGAVNGECWARWDKRDLEIGNKKYNVGFLLVRMRKNIERLLRRTGGGGPFFAIISVLEFFLESL